MAQDDWAMNKAMTVYPLIGSSPEYRVRVEAIAKLLRAERARARRDIRTALADFMATEGCGCCGNYQAHKQAHDRLGLLLGAPKHSDGSGYDFSKYRTKK